MGILEVYINRPQTIEALKANIREEITQNLLELLRKVMLQAQSIELLIVWLIYYYKFDLFICCFLFDFLHNFVCR